MDGFIFPERDLSGIDSQGPLPYAWRMNRETRVGKAAKKKPKRSPKKTVVKSSDDLQDRRENPKEFSEALAYFAKYFDQI